MDLLTTNEAAEKLKVTPIRVRQLIREGKLQAERVGRDYVIAESALKTVIVYGKAGRPTQEKQIKDKASNNQKSFKTIFDIVPEIVGSVDSGINDLGSNKKHLSGLGRDKKNNR